jgi:hypothetical protein
MRILLILIIVAAIGAGAYFSDPRVREKVRGFQVSDTDRERFEAYKQGKELFKAGWTDASRAEFKVWGDDPSETATSVPGRTGIWLARGSVTVDSGGTKAEEPWCIAFDRTSGHALGHALVGSEAAEGLKRFDSGEVQKAGGSAPGAPGQANIIGKPTPAPGSWMWSKEGRPSLDQPAYKGKPH